MSSSRTSSLTKLPSAPPKLAIVLLAAGEGSRMGSFPKALLRKDGKTLLESFCIAVSELKPIEFLVMTGFHAQLIETELHRLHNKYQVSIGIKRQPAPQEGQAATVRLALESLHTDFDVLVMCLSDQPNITAKTIQELLEQYDRCDEHQQIVMPIVNDQRGNPVLFSKSAIEAILTVPGMTCRRYMDLHPELVKCYPSTHSAFIDDVDTVEDVQRWGLTR